jgi:hypothetical protein
MPFIDQIIDDCASHEALSFMDGFSGYNQIQIHPADQYKTAFITPWRTFAYRVMPFGLKNAGATFQRAMTYIFHDLAAIILAYLDDLTVRSKKCLQHLDDLRTIFQQCHQYNIRLNPLKCVFCVTAERLLGLLFLKTVSPWTPSKSKPSQKFHLLGICDSYRVYRAKPTFLGALFLITLYAHMVSFTYYVTTSLFIGTTMPNNRLTTLKKHFPVPL